MASCVTLRAGDLGLWLLEGPSANELWCANCHCGQTADIWEALQLLCCSCTPWAFGSWRYFMFVYMFFKKVMQGKLFLQASHY